MPMKHLCHGPAKLRRLPLAFGLSPACLPNHYTLLVIGGSYDSFGPLCAWEDAAGSWTGLFRFTGRGIAPYLTCFPWQRTYGFDKVNVILETS